ncbi:hypothetical protein EBE87_25915 [Pseudoroseomonas wenyumeiae]|uniref:Septation protein SpoVG n=1 Tax=Teichococcus wenyumeiae TaxID=2478470 RepID=A0A3A9J7U1_9PROT|nr:hypothetical protein [Pseudoroseomonas wenyumeiae]RKK03317.1 hypothetical protein D6Z83_15265 [Pseudoroseomonas wenyumeiae]RMI15415.1 hypothetical protein EBE87_25915 [Pseudoroseomonas wenyumeiae]
MKAPLIERVVVKVIDRDLAFVELRLPGVLLKGMRAHRKSDGSVFLQPPTREGSDGRFWPLYTLQPGIAEAAVRAVRAQWSLADQHGLRGYI